MNKFDMMGKDAFNRVEEIMNATKLNEFLHRKEEEEKKKTCVLWILAIIGVVAAVAAIAYGVYRFFTPDYLEDFEDDFEDDFDDDFFDEEEAKAVGEGTGSGIKQRPETDWFPAFLLVKHIFFVYTVESQ